MYKIFARRGTPLGNVSNELVDVCESLAECLISIERLKNDYECLLSQCTIVNAMTKRVYKVRFTSAYFESYFAFHIIKIECLKTKKVFKTISKIGYQLKVSNGNREVVICQYAPHNTSKREFTEVCMEILSDNLTLDNLPIIRAEIKTRSSDIIDVVTVPNVETTPIIFEYE